MAKGVTNKEHQRNLMRISIAIDKSNELLRNAGIRVELLQSTAQSPKRPGNLSNSLKSKRTS
jgi:hypothetical protein